MRGWPKNVESIEIVLSVKLCWPLNHFVTSLFLRSSVHKSNVLSVSMIFSVTEIVPSFTPALTNLSKFCIVSCFVDAKIQRIFHLKVKACLYLCFFIQKSALLHEIGYHIHCFSFLFVNRWSSERRGWIYSDFPESWERKAKPTMLP